MSEQAIAAYRRSVMDRIVINFSMFLVEIVAGLMAQSIALQADAIDFFGDSFAYLITLLVLGMSLRWRSSGRALFQRRSSRPLGHRQCRL